MIDFKGMIMDFEGIYLIVDFSEYFLERLWDWSLVVDSLRIFSEGPSNL